MNIAAVVVCTVVGLAMVVLVKHVAKGPGRLAAFAVFMMVWFFDAGEVMPLDPKVAENNVKFVPVIALGVMAYFGLRAVESWLYSLVHDPDETPDQDDEAEDPDETEARRDRLHWQN